MGPNLACCVVLQVSDEAERSLLVKLKTECGYQFTSKLESMFTDIKTSRDTMQDYKASRRAASSSDESDIDLSVQACTLSCTLPSVSAAAHLRWCTESSPPANGLAYQNPMLAEENVMLLQRQAGVHELSTFQQHCPSDGARVVRSRHVMKGGSCGVQVLTTGSWPTQTAAKCNLPRELERCCEDFKTFYLASHSGRKLSWQTNMGHAGMSHHNQEPPLRFCS